MIPRPPCCAMAMAMCDSVTVSMAALMMGTFSRMLREIWVCVLVFAGTTSERAGRSNTSSNVRASGTGKWIIGFWMNFYCRERVEIRQIETAGATIQPSSTPCVSGHCSTGVKAVTFHCPSPSLSRGGFMSRSISPLVVASTLAAIMAVPSVLRAQETTSEIPSVTIRASTRLVLVDVVVTDKKGQPITGLKAEDFTVEENGKKQKIASFSPPGADQKAPQPVPPGLLTNRPEYLKPAGVPTVLLLDAANSHFLDQAYGRGQMLKYVLEQSAGGSPMAVMTLTGRLQVLQDFTSDPKILTTAIRKLQPQEPILQSMAAPAQGNVEPGLRSTSANVPVAPSGQFAELVAISQAQVESFQD